MLRARQDLLTRPSLRCVGLLRALSEPVAPGGPRRLSAEVHRDAVRQLTKGLTFVTAADAPKGQQNSPASLGPAGRMKGFSDTKLRVMEWRHLCPRTLTR